MKERRNRPTHFREALIRCDDSSERLEQGALPGAVDADDPGGLARTYEEIDRLEKTEVKTTTYTRWRETFQSGRVSIIERSRL